MEFDIKISRFSAFPAKNTQCRFRIIERCQTLESLNIEQRDMLEFLDPCGTKCSRFIGMLRR